MSAHTPGPWVAECDPSHFDTLSTVVAGAKRKSKGIDRQMIVQVGGRAHWREQEANTRLIASAPDLLAQLSDLVEIASAAIEAEDWKVDGCCDPSLTLDRARAAIAKAEGRP